MAVHVLHPAPESLTETLMTRPDDDIMIVTASEHYTAERARELVAGYAARLSGLGVRPGDRVATLQPLTVRALAIWWALDRLGAVYLPLNPGWSPRLAARVVRDRGPSLLITDPACQPLAEAAVRGAATQCKTRLVREPGPGDPAQAPPVAPRDPLEDCCIVHNSGLPGIHHGVRASWRSLTVMGAGMAANHPGARVLVGAPTCFMGTLASITGTLAGGGSVALLPRLDAATFWPAIRAAGVQFAGLLDPTLADLMAAPARENDRDHPLRGVTASAAQAALNTEAVERFGFHWLTGLAKTEVCGAVGTGLDPQPGEGTGRVLPPFRGRVVDTDGQPVAADSPGELVLQCDIEGGLTPGYADDPAASAELWRDGWLRTGWHVREDASGNLHPEADLSVHPIVVKRAGYLFSADLEAEIVAVTECVNAARVGIIPPVDAVSDPVVIAWVTGENLLRDSVFSDLRVGLPAHLVPDVIVPVDSLPESPDPLQLPEEVWSAGPH